ncbi:IS66 family insertion sequence element accessory protein TnpA [Dyadobacter psychrotolerans]|uniref:Uncharacterized protein n=1 Tax=Dyadobacter psychrotolerans TaxID=2541721 RepID=A0A4R5D7S2_9BACT|nr:hypothetical protein E0F88_30235 [Dyadobacter psychrotolerans]
MDQSEKLFNLVWEWRESGLTQKEFSKPHAITVAKFGYGTGKEKSDSRKIKETRGTIVFF